MRLKEDSFGMFILSYSPLICMVIFAILFLTLLLMTIVDQGYIMEIDLHRFLVAYFEPIAISIFILTIVTSVSLAIYFWNDISSNDKISDEDKKRWKKLFFKISLFANAFYYDYKYNRVEPQYFLEDFLRRSRDKMFGHVDIPS